jgi:hypothetical protein
METLKLDLTVDDAKDLLTIYENKLDEFIKNNQDVIKRYTELLDKRIKINRLLDQNNIAHTVSPDSGNLVLQAFNPSVKVTLYPSHGTWNAKIKFCLNEELGLLTSRQIMDAIAIREGVTDWNSEEFKRIRIGVSANLSTNSGEHGLYKREKNKNGDFVYRVRK